jgi:hypothetical protein
MGMLDRVVIVGLHHDCRAAGVCAWMHDGPPGYVWVHSPILLGNRLQSIDRSCRERPDESSEQRRHGVLTEDPSQSLRPAAADREQ